MESLQQYFICLTLFIGIRSISEERKLTVKSQQHKKKKDYHENKILPWRTALDSQYFNTNTESDTASCGWALNKNRL